MLYLPELDYLQDEKDFPFQKAVLVTATVVSHWSTHFYAELIVPKVKNIRSLERSGALPVTVQDKDAFIDVTFSGQEVYLSTYLPVYPSPGLAFLVLACPD